MQKKKFKLVSSKDPLKEEFYSFLHELGNSLTVLKGNCQLILQSGKIDSNQKKRLKNIEQEIKKVEKTMRKYS